MESVDIIDSTMQEIADYIQHNQHTNLSAHAATLKSAGYAEPFGAGRYYRALFQQVTEQDKEKHLTIGDLFDTIKQDIRIDMSLGVQGFTTSEEEAMHFINGQLFYRGEYAYQHSKNDLIEKLRDIVVVYEVEAPADAIIMSMRGLQAFIKTVPHGPGYVALNHSLNDMHEGYGQDDEVMIDSTKGVRVLGVHLYDSDLHGPDVI